jgi:hypothetical protein
MDSPANPPILLVELSRLKFNEILGYREVLPATALVSGRALIGSRNSSSF